MPHLLNVWPSVSKRFREANRVLLLFDYDGTLTPIVGRPDQAVLPPETKRLITDLSSTHKYVLGVVSGRSLEDVRDRVGVPGIIYAGNHGLEIEGIGEKFLHPEAQESVGLVDQIYQQLSSQIAECPGVIAENKGLTLSIHYRLTPDDLVGRVESTFKAVVAPFQDSGQVRVTSGKKVLEVRPNVVWDKGKAIAKIMEVHSEASLTTFFGDDLTDEDGFDVVQKAEGVAVFVGPARQPTRALYRVDSPKEVAEALHLLSQV